MQSQHTSLQRLWSPNVSRQTLWGFISGRTKNRTHVTYFLQHYLTLTLSANARNNWLQKLVILGVRLCAILKTGTLSCERRDVFSSKKTIPSSTLFNILVSVHRWVSLFTILFSSWLYNCTFIPFVRFALSTHLNEWDAPLKGQCHYIQWFFALFLREQKMAVARASVADIRPESLAVRAAWQSGHLATLAACWHHSAVNQRQVKPELHCFTCRRRQAALLFSGYEARARWYPLLQGSRLAATAISIIRYRFFILVFGSARLPKLASAISSPRAWVTGRRNGQCGRGSLSSDFDDVCHCEGKCADRGTSSRNGCRRSCRHRLCCGIRTVRDKDLKTQETHLW